MKTSNEIGKRYGRLVIISYSHHDKRKGHYYNCKCDCDNIPKSPFRLYALKNNNTKSCGCLFREVNSKSGENSNRWRGHGEISGVYFNQILSMSKKRGINFDISIEEIWQLFLIQDKKCALTGLPLIINTRRYQRVDAPKENNGTASLDRIDNSKGYEAGNIQWVHKNINIMKNIFPQQEFIAYCHLVAENNQKPNINLADNTRWGKTVKLHSIGRKQRAKLS